MSGFDAAVQAYINENGRITETVYGSLKDLFCEYREEQYGKNTVDSMTGALEQKQTLMSLKNAFFKKLDDFYTNECVKSADETIKKKLGAKANASGLTKCKSKLSEQAGIARNVISVMIDNFIGLSQSAGKKLISIMNSATYSITTHNAIIKLCNSSIAEKAKNVSDAIKKAAKAVGVAAIKAGKALISAASKSWFVLAILIEIGILTAAQVQAPNERDVDYASRVDKAVVGGFVLPAAGAGMDLLWKGLDDDKTKETDKK